MSTVRVGVLLEGPRLAAWAAWVLRAIAEHRDLALALVIIAPAPRAARPRLFALYEWLDRRLFRREPDASEVVDCSPLLEGIPRQGAADVIVRLGGGDPADALVAATPYGVWSLRWGRGAPSLFWELSARAPVADCVLEMRTAAGTVEVARSAYRLDVISLERNRNAGYWKGARLLLRRLEDLAARRWEPPGAEAVPRRDVMPGDADTMRHVAAVTGRVARRKLHDAVCQHQWFVGVRRRTGDRLPHEDPSPWRSVLPPPDRSYADPFVLRHGTDTLVFLEELLHRTGRGRLAVGRLEGDGELRSVAPILPCDHHTSYPYVFRHEGKLFLIPESGATRRVVLFAAVELPDRWEPVAALLDGVEAVDATVHAHDGMLWMWLTVGDETFLYFSDRLEAGWTPHPCNPVVADVRAARSAGRPFVHRGRLIRPAQNGAERYGGRVVFNEVAVLTPDAYRERPCGSLGPDWAGGANLAAHTYTFDAEWEATDGLRTFVAAQRRTAENCHDAGLNTSTSTSKSASSAKKSAAATGARAGWNSPAIARTTPRRVAFASTSYSAPSTSSLSRSTRSSASSSMIPSSPTVRTRTARPSPSPATSDEASEFTDEWSTASPWAAATARGSMVTPSSAPTFACRAANDPGSGSKPWISAPGWRCRKNTIDVPMWLPRSTITRASSTSATS